MVAANIIADNFVSQVYSNGHYSQLLDCITNIRCDNRAIAKSDGYNTTKRGKRKICETILGCNVEIKWKDGTKQWVPLSLIKESNLIKFADFVKARGIDAEPAFAWWVPRNFRKCDMIIANINERVSKRMHKFGIEMPN